VVILYFKKLE